MGVKVGIDLGTTFSAVAWVNPQTGKPEVVRSDANSSRLITPSAIQFFKDGSYVCGAQAKEAFEDAEDGVTTGFKREMGTDTSGSAAFYFGGRHHQSRAFDGASQGPVRGSAEAGVLYG